MAAVVSEEQSITRSVANVASTNAACFSGTRWAISA